MPLIFPLQYLILLVVTLSQTPTTWQSLWSLLSHAWIRVLHGAAIQVSYTPRPNWVVVAAQVVHVAPYA